MKGKMEIDERGNVYNIVEQLEIKDGVEEVRDEFDFIDIFKMKNRMKIKNKCESLKELI